MKGDSMKRFMTVVTILSQIIFMLCFILGVSERSLIGLGFYALWLLIVTLSDETDKKIDNIWRKL